MTTWPLKFWILFYFTFKPLTLGPDFIMICLLLPFLSLNKYSPSAFLTDVLLSSAYELS